jgi:hypothetical protein
VVAAMLSHESQIRLRERITLRINSPSSSGKASNCIRWDEVRILRRGIVLACSNNDHFQDTVFPSKAVSLRFESSKYSLRKTKFDLFEPDEESPRKSGYSH